MSSGLDGIIQQRLNREMETIKLTLSSYKKEEDKKKMSNTTLIYSTLLTCGETWPEKR